MRDQGPFRRLAASLLFLGLVVACESGSPTGPGSVTLTEPTPPTTTTSIPGPGPTTTSTTTTSIPTISTTRTYVAFGPAPPIAPSQLTVLLQPLTRQSVLSSLVRNLPLIGGAADPPQWTVTGFYTTPNGGQGRVTGELEGTLDAGTFQGTLTSETPECVAEREFGGSLDPQFLRWTGGTTLRNCKGDPLDFSPLVMLATAAPPPTTTAISSSTTTMPLTCSYSLSANSVSIGAGGGPGSVGVTTTPSCAWTVQNFAPWITVQPTSASGAGTVNFTVAANPGPPRSATLVIAGLPFVVNQGVVTTTTTTSTTTTSTTTTSVVPMPDLLPFAPSTGFCTVSSVDDATFGDLLVSIRNQGNAAATSFVTRVLFDNGSSATPVDRVIPSLAGQGAATTVNFDIPSSCRTANCRILITVDVNSSVAESNESNNTASASCDFTIIELRRRGLN